MDPESGEIYFLKRQKAKVILMIDKCCMCNEILVGVDMTPHLLERLFVDKSQGDSVRVNS